MVLQMKVLIFVLFVFLGVGYQLPFLTKVCESKKIKKQILLKNDARFLLSFVVDDFH
jgi:hypothetical protein